DSKLFNISTSQGNPIFFSYGLSNLSFSSADAKPSIGIGEVKFDIRIPVAVGSSTQYNPVGFQSPVTLREGEKVVVGTTTMGDKGIVLVLSARIINVK